ncbi:MAG: hypothetical protein Q7R79_03600 [bacterium]|nr:hypothetical protein [bacterium]
MEPGYISYRVTSNDVQEYGKGLLCCTKEMAIEYRRKENIAEELGRRIESQFPGVHFLGEQFCCPYIAIPKNEEDGLVKEISKIFTVTLEQISILSMDDLLEFY